MTAISPAPEADAPNAAESSPRRPACMASTPAIPAARAARRGDVATIAAMGAHALPVVTSIVMRDTAEIFDHHAIDADVDRRAGAQRF